MVDGERLSVTLTKIIPSVLGDGKLDGASLVFRSLTGVQVCFLRRFGGKFHQELWAGNTILLGRPSAEVGELAAL